MKLDDQLRLATWLLAQGEKFKAQADTLPSDRKFFGERMRIQGAAEACFTLCKLALDPDFNEALYAEPNSSPPAGDENQTSLGVSDLYKIGEKSVP